jgi:hypothetical protein
MEKKRFIRKKKKKKMIDVKFFFKTKQEEIKIEKNFLILNLKKKFQSIKNFENIIGNGMYHSFIFNS